MLDELRAARAYITSDDVTWVPRSPKRDGEVCAAFRGRLCSPMLSKDAQEYLAKIVGRSLIGHWNDYFATSKQDVLDLYDRAIAQLEAGQ
jgi:hypothetical protein